MIVLLVLIFLLVFLGYTLWQIWKIIRSAKSQVQNQTQQVAGEMLAEFQATNEPISLVITQATTITVIQPFEPGELSMRILRSTNLIDWEVVGTNRSGETWTDTNAPWPNGFYRQEVVK